MGLLCILRGGERFLPLTGMFFICETGVFVFVFFLVSVDGHKGSLAGVGRDS